MLRHAQYGREDDWGLWPSFHGDETTAEYGQKACGEGKKRGKRA